MALLPSQVNIPYPHPFYYYFFLSLIHSHSRPISLYIYRSSYLSLSISVNLIFNRHLSPIVYHYHYFIICTYPSHCFSFRHSNIPFISLSLSQIPSFRSISESSVASSLPAPRILSSFLTYPSNPIPMYCVSAFLLLSVLTFCAFPSSPDPLNPIHHYGYSSLFCLISPGKTLLVYSICLFVFLSISVCLSVCVSFCLSLSLLHPLYNFSFFFL